MFCIVSRDHYFTMVSWQNNTHVLVAWMNRPQNVSILLICDASSDVISDRCKQVILIYFSTSNISISKVLMSLSM